MVILNPNKVIWEGWTVIDFINELNPIFNMIVNKQSHIKDFTTKKELKKWCMENQPYYKKHIPEVFDFFCERYEKINKKKLT